MVLSSDQKWEKVKPYYERAYKITFSKRPSDEKIEFLWAEMCKLSKSLEEEYKQGRPHLIRFLGRQKKSPESSLSLHKTQPSICDELPLT